MSHFSSLVTLTQGHQDGRQNFFPHPKVDHVWFEEISFSGFPGKLKSVGRTAAAAETETTKNNKSPGYPGWLNYLASHAMNKDDDGNDDDENNNKQQHHQQHQ